MGFASLTPDTTDDAASSREILLERLRDARAQIAEKDAECHRFIVRNASLTGDLVELRAQIAAKDAALVRITIASGAEAKRNIDEVTGLRAQIAAKDEALVRLYRRLQKASRGGPLVVSYDPELTDVQAAEIAARETDHE